MYKPLFLVGLVAMMVGCCPPASSKELPASPRTYVHNEGVLTQSGAITLSRKLSDYEKSSNHQMVVAAFQSLDGADLQDYTNKLFKAWKIGDKKRNDGVLFAIFIKDHKWRVEVGYGLEGVLPDAAAYEIATKVGVPYFKKGDFDNGILEVVKSLQARIK